MREPDERFRLLVESIGDYAIFMLDANGMVTTWNRGAERIKGSRADEIIGQHFSRFYLDEEVRAGVCERELEQAARGARFEGEGWRTRKDGSRFWASVVITAIRDPDNGGLLGFSNVTNDLTQRRLTDEALRESEERFRLTIDEAPNGMALVSLDGRFVRVNRAFCEVVGYEAAELMNLRFREITHPEDVDVDLALAGQLARGEIPRCQFEKRYIRKDGTIVDTTVSVSILRDAAGAPLNYISQIEDITERKRVEKELRDANVFLDAIVENIPLMLFIKESASLRFVRFNRAEKTCWDGRGSRSSARTTSIFGLVNRLSSSSRKIGRPPSAARWSKSTKSRFKRAIKASASCARKRFRFSIRPAIRSICWAFRRTSRSDGELKRNGACWPRSTSRSRPRSTTSRPWRP